jgi:hypothetical protein
VLTRLPVATASRTLPGDEASPAVRARLVPALLDASQDGSAVATNDGVLIR